MRNCPAETLMALVFIKRAFRPAAGRRTAPIVPGQIHRCQRDAIAAQRAVIIIVLQSDAGNARLGTAMRASYKRFASCHTCIPFLSRAYKKLLLHPGVFGSWFFVVERQLFPQFQSAFPSKVILLSFAIKPCFVTISSRHHRLLCKPLALINCSRIGLARCRSQNCPHPRSTSLNLTGILFHQVSRTRSRQSHPPRYRKPETLSEVRSWLKPPGAIPLLLFV